jgi:L-ribulose-5-phosphate 3-epimerase
MMNTISFMTANYVARHVGWNMTEGWMQGQNATREWFRSLHTYPARLEEYLVDIQRMGFEAVDFWMPLLDISWATDDHIRIAQSLLRKYNLKVVSLAGGMGSTPEELQRVCQIAQALGAPVLGGGTPLLTENRPFLVNTLKQFGLRLGIENHPEKTPQELLAKIGDGGDGTIGACVDTGWFGTHGYNAADALEQLERVLFHVHLKDVRAIGGHDTCRFGQGVVPIEDCITALQRIGYKGAISVEHEPEHSDPTEDVEASFFMLKEWLQ